jgi:secreted PhoX family phosphatase
MSISRIQFLKQSGAISAGFSGLHLLDNILNGQKVDIASAAEPFGSLKSDPNEIFDLPKDFSYEIISRFGDRMDDGFQVPHRPDGMATFPGPDGETILIRNHEVSAGRKGDESAFGKNYRMASQLDSDLIYDAGKNNNPAQGGTTTLVYDTQNQQVVRQFLSLSGTIRNCAGGPTPWGTWLSCEEIVFRSNERYAKDHGYVFEVKATSKPHVSKPQPIKAMGRFNHEAVAVDPNSNVIYLTEDDSEGLLYRFIPNTPEKLLDGGTLQALMVEYQPSLDSRNWDEQTVAKNRSMSVEWIDLEDIDDEDMRYRGFEAGATRFARGEGMWYGNDAIYFACTNGGANKKGQIWKYTPSVNEATDSEQYMPGKLELFIEPNDGEIIENVDNLTVAPWGDLIACEDGPGEHYLLGVTPKGEVYKLGKNAVSKSELAGAVFSPDGSTLFMNIQHDGLTLAITGPWQQAGA